jgi:hypothetical protein
MRRTSVTAPTNRHTLILSGVGFLLLAYGIVSYRNDEHFVERAVQARATIETAQDEPVQYGGMSRFGGTLHTGHRCTYTLRFQSEQEQTFASTPLTLFEKSCLTRGSSISILYDPKNPQNVRSYIEHDTTPLGKVLISLGVMILGLSYFVWTLKKR